MELIKTKVYLGHIYPWSILAVPVYLFPGAFGLLELTIFRLSVPDDGYFNNASCTLSLCLFFCSPTSPEAKFRRRKKSIYSSKFFHNFHLSESSFTCPGLQASGLAWKLHYITYLYLYYLAVWCYALSQIKSVHFLILKIMMISRCCTLYEIRSAVFQFISV